MVTREKKQQQKLAMGTGPSGTKLDRRPSLGQGQIGVTQLWQGVIMRSLFS